MRLIAIALVVLLAGCTSTAPRGAESSPESEPTTNDAEAQGSDEEPRQIGGAAEGEPAAVDLAFEHCVGPSIMFDFDGAAADNVIPHPFTPIGLHNPATGWTRAYGHVLHRQCDVTLQGNELGRVDLAFDLMEVKAPASMAKAFIPFYLAGLHSNSMELLEFLEGQGIPGTLGSMSDDSQWPMGWTGVFDTQIGSARIAGVLPGVVPMEPPDADVEIFHHDGEEITKWTLKTTTAAAGLAESVIELDMDLWGSPVAANWYFSTYSMQESSTDHRFSKYDKIGQRIS